MKYRKKDMVQMWIRLIARLLVLSVLICFAGDKAITAGQKNLAVWKEKQAAELARKESLEAEESIAASLAESEAESRSLEESIAAAKEAEKTAENTDPEEVYQDYYEDESLTYFINTCDSKELEYSDISGFDQTTCRLALNGIYARSGRGFKDEALTAFYSGFSWYHATINPDDFTDSAFNKHQIKNRDMLVKYMKEKGYR
ncbi:MAG: YARHG domain-containing protein, partial [Lachnospiraceae bacterium]|nr:YARHG domain-containing protein [Lachnospiraceae bacterium]